MLLVLRTRPAFRPCLPEEGQLRLRQKPKSGKHSTKEKSAGAGTFVQAGITRLVGTRQSLLELPLVGFTLVTQGD